MKKTLLAFSIAVVLHVIVIVGIIVVLDLLRDDIYDSASMTIDFYAVRSEP